MDSDCRLCMISGCLVDILQDIFKNNCNIRPVQAINKLCPFTKDICTLLVRIKAACYVDELRNDCAEITQNVRIFEGLKIDPNFTLKADNQNNTEQNKKNKNDISFINEIKGKDSDKNLFPNVNSNVNACPLEAASEQANMNHKDTIDDIRSALNDEGESSKYTWSNLDKREQTYITQVYAKIFELRPELGDYRNKDKSQGITYIKSFREKYCISPSNIGQVEGIKEANSYTEAMRALWAFSNRKQKEAEPNVKETTCPF